MSDFGQLFSNVSKLLRDESIVNLLDENKILKSKSTDAIYGVKIKILEHMYDLGRRRQPNTFGCILKLEKDNVICLLHNEDGVHIRPISYYHIRIFENDNNSE